MPFQGLICLQHIEQSFNMRAHTTCHKPRCAGERREQRWRREGRGRMNVRGRVHVRRRVWVRVHVPAATAWTAQELRAATACVGSSRGCMPFKFHSRTPLARREAAHAVREVVLEPVTQSTALISGHPLQGWWRLPLWVGWEGRPACMSSSGSGAGAVQARLYYIACHEYILTMMKMVVYMCTVAIVLSAVTWI
ncbi:hypothetical protein JB92DRAFT_2829681 [Gautieria morchelliformis]|nr:hypothetical protein JB92DRAFT_2829681 [Gautieria morchelliformis]